jgi:type I restriction enzyme S subunit
MKAEPIASLVEPIKQSGPSVLALPLFTYIDIASVDRDIKRIISATTLPVDQAPSRAKQLVTVDDVLVSTVRPNLNATALVMPWLDRSIASTGFCALRARKSVLDPKYLFYFT